MRQPVVSDRVQNIEAPGIRRRRNGGIAMFAVGAIAAALLITFRAPHLWRILLVLPFAAGAIGLLQARERT
jgi:hypothetical protein